VFLLVFSLWLGWLPAQGMQSLREPLAGLPYVVDLLAHLLLPGTTLALYKMALLSRLTRTAMVEVLRDRPETAPVSSYACNASPSPLTVMGPRGATWT
jgi:ABC-type dipeptide/oligopeptide/nickel transport system permease component